MLRSKLHKMTNIQSKLLFFIINLFFVASQLSAQTFDFTADRTQGCTPLQVTFTNTTDIAYRNNYHYEWTVEPTKFSTEIDSVYNTYITPGQYTIIMRAYDIDNNLVSTITKTDYITAFRDPDVTILSDKQEDCEFKPFQFSIGTVTSDAPLVDYTWVISDGTSYDGEVPPAHYFTYAGDFDIIVAVKDANGCTNRIRNKISVKTYNDYPSVNFTPSAQITCENTLNVTFTNSTPPTNVASMNWSFGDGVTSTVVSPSHTYNGFGNYTAQLTATSNNGCSRTVSRSIQLVDYRPDFTIVDASKTITTSNKACPGTITFIDATSPAGTITYAWDLENNGSTDATTRNYMTSITTPGNHQIKLTVNNGICTKSITKTFEVEPELVISYEPDNLFICEIPASVNYNATSNIPNTEFQWIINGIDTIINNNFNYIYSAEGFFTDAVYATSPNSCKTDVIKPNNIEIAIPHVYIVPHSATSGCVPLSTSFDTIIQYNTSSDFVENVKWDFKNDGIFEVEGTSPVTYIYDETGEFDAIVKIETNKGCDDTDGELILVGDTPNGTVSLSDSVICANMPIFATFTPDDPNRYTTIYDNISITFTPEVPNSYPPPANGSIAPTLNPEIQVILDDSIGVHNLSYVINDHGCDESFTDPQKVRVKGPIIKIGGTNADCENPYNYSYFLTKKINVEYMNWYIEKISGSNQFSPRIFATDLDTVTIDFNDASLGRGNYNIYAIAHNDADGCTYSSNELITQVRDIQANFNLATYTPCLGDTAIFSINGQDAAQSFWYRPYDTLITWPIRAGEDSIFYIFNSTEIKDVTIYSIDVNNCYDTITKPVKVYQPHAYFFADIISDCLPFQSAYTDTTVSDTTIISRFWDFGNGETLAGNQTTYSTEYNSEGLRSPSLIVTDILGCKDTIVKSNYIRPVVPNSRFVVAHPKVCLNHDAQFIRNTTNPNYDNNIHRYEWDFGDGSTDAGSLQDTVPHTYTAESNAYNVRLTAYSMSPEGNECVSTSTGVVEVKEVSAIIDIAEMDLCKEPGEKFIVYLDNSWYRQTVFPYAYRYTTVNWTKIDGGVSKYIGNSQSTRVVTYDNYGDQTLILETTSPYYGCEEDSVAVTIEVPGYEARIIADKDEVCVKEDVTFTLVDTVNIYRYNRYWEFGDGNTNNTDFDGVVHSYTSLAESIDNTFKIQFIIDAPNCRPRDIFTNVTVYPVLADFNRGINDTDTIGCAPFSVHLFNESEGAATYVWDFGDGTTSTAMNPTHTFPKIDTVYNVRISVTSSICNDFLEKPVSTHPFADVDFALDSSLCVGSSTPIVATGDFTTISWTPARYFTDPNAASTTVTPTFSGYVTANVETQYECPSKDSVYIFVQQYPVYQGAPDSLLLYYFTPDSLRLTTRPDGQIIAGQLYNVNNTPIAGVYYTWTPDTYLSCNDCPSPNIDLQCGTPTRPSCIDFPETVQYTIYMTDSLGCFENEASILFNIVIKSKAALPEAFSPNTDGENDFAFVRGWGVKEFLEVRIYNRWGQLVYSSTDMYEGWDGTYKGEPQAMDTYAYTIRYIDTKDEEQFVKGYITLLR